MDRKLQRHRADSLRQHGFLVLFFTTHASSLASASASLFFGLDNIPATACCILYSFNSIL